MNAHQMPQADDSDALSTAGDASTWLDEHGDVLYRYARSRIGHRELAEDLVQDTLLAALQSRDRFQGRATVRTWLLSILRHKIVDHCRRTATSISPAEADPIARPDPVRARYFSAKGLWKKALASWKGYWLDSPWFGKARHQSCWISLGVHFSALRGRRAGHVEAPARPPRSINDH